MMVGAVFGLLIGFFIPRWKLGCLVLLIIPITMFYYVDWWQDQHPEILNSTSGLQYFFGPLWPSFGAMAGYYMGTLARVLFGKDAQ